MQQESGKFDETLENLRQAVIDSLGNIPNQEEIAKKAVESIVYYFGGQVVYIPKNATTYLRNKIIREEFNGSNHAELSRKYRVSMQWIYKIVKGEV